MTAPIWMATPPEVHSALLSSGPGPGPLLEAAAAWTALSTEYTAAAAELTAVLSAVQAGSWEGPSAESYAAAHAPYLAWLLKESANGAALAAEQQTAAAAYTTALAAMPTLGELAANHATHAVLTATNFFGINTIPIALNEADYVRMWVQAATVMSTYQGVASAAVASAPQSEPAPAIVKSAAATDPSSPPAWYTDLENYLEGLFPQPSTYPTVGPEYQALLNFFNQIGFTDVNDPIAAWLQSLPSSYFPPLGVPGSWLAYGGSPLAYLNPESLAYALAVPLDPSSYVAFTGLTVVDDLLAVVYTAAFNPQALIVVAPAAFVEASFSTVLNTIQLLHYILESTLPAILPTLLPVATASLVPLTATPVGLAGLAGVAGIAPAATTPLLTPVIAMTPPPPPPPLPPAPIPPLPAPVTVAHAPFAAPAPLPPPTPAGPPGVTMPAYMYMVGDLGLAAQAARSASKHARKTAADSAEIPSAAPLPDEKQPVSRRRKAKATMIGRGYEYMDLEPEPTASPSDRAAGVLGFAGSAARDSVSEPAGLATLSRDTFGTAASAPMLPGTWQPDLDEDRRRAAPL